MSFSRLVIRSLLTLGLLATGAVERATASEPGTVAAVPSAVDLQLQQYVYVDFPRQLQMLDNETALAERFVVLQRQRVNGYRPFRSFHQYGATYFADQSAQLQLLAAQHELACLYQRKTDLWRERQTIVTMLLAAQASSRQ
jgi:hypothetical protein